MFALMALVVLAVMAWGSISIELRDRRERKAEAEAEGRASVR